MDKESDLVSIPRTSTSQRVATLLVVTLPFLGLIAAIVKTWGWGVTATELALFFGMYLISGLGITVGYHRLFTHRAFETSRPIRFLLAVFGSTAIQGPVNRWAAIHRQHHEYSDHTNDPHSPHLHGKGVRAVLAGAWHAHMGWMFKADPVHMDRYVQDLEADRTTKLASDLFCVWVLLGLLVPTVVGGLISGMWYGAWLGFLWGGLVRVFFVHHVTYSVNSICHLWGGRSFRSRDESRNNPICGVLAFGEGWHNNHHAFPSSARHGLRWWEFDSSYLVIRMLEFLRLARRVRLPSRAAMAAKRLTFEEKTRIRLGALGSSLKDVVEAGSAFVDRAVPNPD